MPNFIIVAIVLLTTLKDFFKDLFSSKESRFILISILGYIGYTYFKKQEDTKKILDNLPNSEIGNLLVRLNNALHYFFNIQVPFIGYLPFDGVNEKEVLAVAFEVGRLKKYSEFRQAYEQLYKVSLEADLQANDIQEQFNLEYQRGFSGNNTTVPPTTTTPNRPKTPVITSGASVINSAGLKIEVGQSYAVKAGVNLRDPGTLEIKEVTKEGDIYKIEKLVKNVKIGSQLYTVADVNFMLFGYLPSFFTYRVIINAFIRKV
jgi:hypothetical protein